ncbi:MAG: glycosyltransferase [Pirellulales bacterium]|nr:glycosyltransferase [Pirellulales bacterium]
MTPKKVMIVTDLFPPMNGSGVHRIVALCRRLNATGWQVSVLTANDAPPGCPFDDSLLDMIPEHVRVVRAASPDILSHVVRTLKGRDRTGKRNEIVVPTTSNGRSKQPPRGLRCMMDWLSWWLHVPDSRIGWLLPGVLAGLRESRRSRPNVILSSAPAWTSHVLGMVLSRILHVPLVADFRDPWCGSAWHRMPYNAHRWIDQYLESLVVRRAIRITCAWDGIRRHLSNKYPTRRDAIITILNGFDPEIIEEAIPVYLSTTAKVFLHTGTFYGPRSPVPLLLALQQLTSNCHDFHKDTFFVFVGPTVYKGRSLEKIITEYGLQEHIRTLPPVSNREAIALLKGADVAILFGQSGNESLASVPAKVYEYIGLGKPVLAIGAGSEVREVMKSGGCKVWAASADDPQQIASAIWNILKFLRCQEAHSMTEPDKHVQFTRMQTASCLERVLLEAMSNYRSR